MTVLMTTLEQAQRERSRTRAFSHASDEVFVVIGDVRARVCAALLVLSDVMGLRCRWPRKHGNAEQLRQRCRHCRCRLEAAVLACELGQHEEDWR